MSETTQHNYTSKEIIARTIKYVYPFKWLLLGAILLNTIFSALTASAVALIKFVFSILFDVEADYTIVPDSSIAEQFKNSFYSLVNSFLGDPNDIETRLIRIGLIIISIFIVKNIFKYWSSIVSIKLEESIVKNIRDSIFSSLTTLSIDFFGKNRQGTLMSAITNDVNVLNSRTVMGFNVFLRETVQIAFFLTMLLAMSAKLTLIVFSTSILSLLIIQVSRKFLKRYASRMQTAMANYTSTMQESIAGIRVIQAYNAQKIAEERFKADSEYYVKSAVKLQKVLALIPSLNEVFAIAALCVALVIGGMEALIYKSISPDDLMTFLIMIFTIMSPISAVTNIFANAQAGLVAGERIYKLVDSKPLVSDGTRDKPVFRNEIEISNLTFAYTEKAALENINLTIKKGQKVAFVGASGSGKSTILDLLVRFYDPANGAITIDGNNIKEYKLNEYRKLFGVVSQENMLFNDTIENNIKYGMSNASIEQIEEATKLAYAYNFIQKMPEKFQTKVGDRGINISGGERQRIAIARALLRNPEILVFDEATSALDSESEKIVQDAINSSLKDKTAIIVAHRLATILECDMIYVFDRGRIVESGTHKQLCEYNGIYKKLHSIQFGEN